MAVSPFDDTICKSAGGSNDLQATMGDRSVMIEPMADGEGTAIWDLEPGQEIVRKELHRRFGGQGQGGIATPKSSPNVILFTDPRTGLQHGYFDEWVDGELHYCGAGQEALGDQQMLRGNAAILNHRRDGKRIRVFYGSRGTITYAGEFALADDDKDPWYWLPAETSDGGTRQIIRFRLIPQGESIVDEDQPLRPIVAPVVEYLARPYESAEPNPTEARQPFEVDPDAVDRGLAAHARIQNDMAAMAAAAGFQVRSPGPDDPNFDLLWIEPDGTVVVVEVKSLTTDNEIGQIRLGIGQVLDYAHQLRGLGRTVKPVLAVEKKPESDRWDSLCESLGVELVWGERVRRLFGMRDELGSRLD